MEIEFWSFEVKVLKIFKEDVIWRWGWDGIVVLMKERDYVVLSFKWIWFLLFFGNREEMWMVLFGEEERLVREREVGRRFLLLNIEEIER